MGLEAICACQWGAHAGTVKALLESTELILHGDIARRIPLAQITGTRTDGDNLVLSLGHDTMRLELGSKAASRWASKIATPPPTLRSKLGLSDAAPAFVSGKIHDAALIEALAGATTKSAAKAAMSIAEVLTQTQLDAAIRAHAALPSDSPVWIVHGKGQTAALGETAVRARMREAGFIDTKVSAVSGNRSATRFSRRA
jgi:hypothetical protein